MFSGRPVNHQIAIYPQTLSLLCDRPFRSTGGKHLFLFIVWCARLCLYFGCVGLSFEGKWTVGILLRFVLWVSVVVSSYEILWPHLVSARLFCHCFIEVRNMLPLDIYILTVSEVVSLSHKSFLSSLNAKLNYEVIWWNNKCLIILWPKLTFGL